MPLRAIIIHDFISSTASHKNNASRKADKSSYIQLSKMKEDLRKIIGEVFLDTMTQAI